VLLSIVFAHFRVAGKNSQHIKDYCELFTGAVMPMPRDFFEILGFAFPQRDHGFLIRRG